MQVLVLVFVASLVILLAAAWAIARAIRRHGAHAPAAETEKRPTDDRP